MASNKLFSLFEGKLQTPNDLVSVKPQNLDSIGGSFQASDQLVNKIKSFNSVKLKVDYSNFSNFVFFNSALEYFNICGEKMLNEYPFDESSANLQTFENSLDGFEQHTLQRWPKYSGSLKFNPANGFSYVKVEDKGTTGGVAKTSLLNVSTSSFSVDFWLINPPVLTGSSDVMILFQKVSGSQTGLTSFCSASNIYFRISSGSTADTVSASFSPGQKSYYCFSVDRDGDATVASLFTGSESQFPVLSAFVSSSITGSMTIDTLAEPLFIGSGSLSSKTTIALSCSLDEVRFWKKAASVSYLTSSFNSKIYSQDNLTALWRFNEAADQGSSILDSSGNKINGTIQNYYSQIRHSESLLPYDSPDPILSLTNSDVSAYVAEQQLSAALYDRDNLNIITRMLPEQFFLLEEYNGTNILKNFVFVIGRYFDQVKVSIDQFANILKTDYGNFNQTPDALLEDIGKFFGWQFTGNFLDKSAIEYILGKSVLPEMEANKELDTKLYEIKNEFWKRTLINLMHIYKTKGTRESVESLLRIYGVDKNFVKLKEFGSKPNSGIETFRIYSEKSVSALTFGSGSAISASLVSSPHFSGSVGTIETRVRFPTTSSSGLVSTITTGSIWVLASGVLENTDCKLYFQKGAVGDTSGSLVYSGSEGTLELSGASIFDNEWYNVAVIKDASEGILHIDVRSIDRDEVDLHLSASTIAAISSASSDLILKIGATGSVETQMWAQEVRVYNQVLSEVELNDHALNFQSFGTEEVDGLDTLYFHYRLNENVACSSSGTLSIFDFSGNSRTASATGFMNNQNQYKRFLNEFNFIASPELGWNEQKIRSLSGSVVSQEDSFIDNPIVSLEFNLVDALNEDISQILSTLDTFNEIIAAPVNKFRDTYPDLDALRYNYFKRLQGSVNFILFADLLEFFDRSFIELIKKLIPARAIFIGEEFVIESHMLERPKLQWTYRRRDREFEPEGIIKVLIR